jgi:hypothetical protein
LGPSNPKIWPADTSKLTPATASVGPYRFHKSMMETAGSVIAFTVAQTTNFS